MRRLGQFSGPLASGKLRSKPIEGKQATVAASLDRAMVFLTLGTVGLASITSRVNAEYSPATARSAQARKFWHNPQLLRLVSAYAIAYIHMPAVVGAAHIHPAVLEIFRFGTDLFVVLAGFLSAHVLGNNGTSAGAYLRARLIRIVPLYWGFTVLAFLVENYAMNNHSTPLSALFMSLAFVPYGPYPILYPTWTLLVIVEFSLIIAAFQTASAKNGVFYSAAFAVLLAGAGKITRFENPIFVFYTNPILIDFALGILIFTLVSSGPFLFKMPRRRVVVLAAAAVTFGAVAAVLRPFFWPALPRVLALGVPMSLLLLGVVILEQLGIYNDSRFVNFLAKCTYAIYLTHWFMDLISEKLVVESGNSARLATVLLFVTPMAVTCVSVFIYLYVEVPMTRYLSDWFVAPGISPSSAAPRSTTGHQGGAQPGSEHRSRLP
ncbi:acyltransferase [Mesorhizobium sp. CO1-1-7]|uniref:acyltransferase family protein n=1 Tax=unclassified Mesorhizobium TaxID=325217 RepID=UPI00112BFDE9|nr:MULTISPECIES: acyltransferase [unclassified Mesorhizobium]MBZ9748350.1 acyltransferase [Mesorhizobium sp. CO1-1-7]TPL67582.1 acyltransferase [Mesorhizobium sp. B2-3-15]TPL99369.1 acyltransferase [Mesorhizobium sp. B2-3-10]